MFKLVDDGTLDTVIRCTACGEELRYTYDPECNGPVSTDLAAQTQYDLYIAECIEDANQTHDCPEDGNRP